MGHIEGRGWNPEGAGVDIRSRVGVAIGGWAWSSAISAPSGGRHATRRGKPAAKRSQAVRPAHPSAWIRLGLHRPPLRTNGYRTGHSAKCPEFAAAVVHLLHTALHRRISTVRRVGNALPAGQQPDLLATDRVGGSVCRTRCDLGGGHGGHPPPPQKRASSPPNRQVSHDAFSSRAPTGRPLLRLTLDRATRHRAHPPQERTGRQCDGGAARSSDGPQESEVEQDSTGRP